MPLERSEMPSGRLGMLTAMGAAVGFIPFPLLPDRVLRQIRGATAYDAFARHGLSFTEDARRVLAAPNSEDRMRHILRKALELVTRRLLRRLGPLSALGNVASAYELYALGQLSDRYARIHRPRGTVRVHEPEARRLRRHIDSAVLRALSPSLSARPLEASQPPEDMRDEFTRWLDTILITTSTLPSYLERRLEAAFDEVERESPEPTHG
jgi:hypothetical protein